MKNRLRGTSPFAQALVCGLGAVVAVLALAVGGPASAAAAPTVLSRALVVENSPPPVPAFDPSAVCTDWYFREGSTYLGHSGRWEFNCMWGDWWADWYIQEYYWRAATEEIRLAGWAFGWDGLSGARCRLSDVGPTYCDL